LLVSFNPIYKNKDVKEMKKKVLLIIGVMLLLTSMSVLPVVNSIKTEPTVETLADHKFSIKGKAILMYFDRGTDQCLFYGQKTLIFGVYPIEGIVSEVSDAAYFGVTWTFTLTDSEESDVEDYITVNRLIGRPKTYRYSDSWGARLSCQMDFWLIPSSVEITEVFIV
jgi:hypothetical protein